MEGRTGRAGGVLQYAIQMTISTSIAVCGGASGFDSPTLQAGLR